MPRDYDYAGREGIEQTSTLGRENAGDGNLELRLMRLQMAT